MEKIDRMLNKGLIGFDLFWESFFYFRVESGLEDKKKKLGKVCLSVDLNI